MNNKKFLVTKNSESASILRKMGFRLVNEDNGRYTFLNNKNIVFQKLDDVAATDILCF